MDHKFLYLQNTQINKITYHKSTRIIIAQTEDKIKRIYKRIALFI